MPAAGFLVRGRVQGVGFRWFVWREADRLGLRGIARNLPDGSVEVMAEGLENALEEFERALNRGPAAARVEQVEKREIPHDLTLPKRFEIY
ncbi:MAG TPA: acylphosphatase [Gemmatimonadales bacterium]|nr:acylphosphatase [Gemmatimonadales bacterium]